MPSCTTAPLNEEYHLSFGVTPFQLHKSVICAHLQASYLLLPLPVATTVPRSEHSSTLAVRQTNKGQQVIFHLRLSLSSPLSLRLGGRQDVSSERKAAATTTILATTTTTLPVSTLSALGVLVSASSSLSDLCCLFLIVDLVFEAAPRGGGGGGSVALPVLPLSGGGKKGAK
mgnify:CR=1 FL=1